MNKTGEKPGKGHYKCKGCGQVIRLVYNNDELPPCTNCKNTTCTSIV